jgi:hypothetical protein
MMPPHFTREPPDGPLEENLFEVEGYTLGISDFSVHDETADQACAVEVDVDETCEVADRWKDHEDPPPGSIQYRSVVKVRFTPAVPGHRYRLDGPADPIVREYAGPEVAGS